MSLLVQLKPLSDMDFQNTERHMVDDLEPQTRDRCNTWPLRPIIDPPSMHDSESNPAEGVIKEEPEDIESGRIDSHSQHNLSGGQDSLPVVNTQGLCMSTAEPAPAQSDLSNAKKSTARKNAWGNLSYADLITKAIQSSPEKKLTLSQIYDWMVQNVSYFRDKGDSTSSAGWKNSIRHNLSLHNRFMRIQNEGAGKSSWWVINPDAKPGKAPRRPRGGSMDSTKLSLEASRKRAMRKVKEMKKQGLYKDGGSHSPVSPANEFTLSPGGDYRERASSFASNISGRHSPQDFDIFDSKQLSPWGSESQLVGLNDIKMETGGSGEGAQLHQDLVNLDLAAPGGGYLSELEEISSSVVSGPFIDQGMSQQSMYPYSSYTGDRSNNFSAPPPPYPADQGQQQQHYNKVNMTGGTSNTLYKDPLMTAYNNTKSNNNSLSPNQVCQQYAGYSNGIISGQTSQQQQGRPPAQREMPSSIREALRPSNQTISQSLKDRAPILTQQLLDYRSSSSNQSQQSTYNPSQMSGSQQQQSFNQYQPEQNGMFMNIGGGGGLNQINSQGYYPTDIDLNFDQMPELLSCDVEEVIQQELRMGGGHLDFAGFEDYSQQQQQQQAGSNNNLNGGILSQTLE